MIFTLIWSLIIWSLVFWGTKAAGVSVPWQVHVAIILFLIAPAVARLFSPEPRTRRRRR